jgi:bifunctional non-homologous end joining protein LigD
MRSLSTYRQKRDFERTREPRGAARRQGGFSYVIQKHAARRLHYDFRLELDGVLLSWAVPKGPSLDPKVRRLAQQTEDHPLEYGGFEGTIPKGEYGGGTVMLWDRGSWVPEGDAREQYEKGRLTFELRGERLTGRWHLVRTGRDHGKSWLLFKGRDQVARDEGDALLEEATTSVASQRTMDEIASGAPARTRGRAASRTKARATSQATTSTKTTKVSRAPKSTRRVRTLRKLAVPKPELATLVDRVPEGDDWLHEIKFDGYRILARVADGQARLITRNGNDWTDRLGALAGAFRELDVTSALLDGELVVLGENGISSFQRLQNALSSGEAAPLIYCVFDLL